MESPNNGNNNSGTNYGFSDAVKKMHIFYVNVFGCHSFVVFGKIIGLSQLVYWLKSIEAHDL